MGQSGPSAGGRPPAPSGEPGPGAAVELDGVVTGAGATGADGDSGVTGISLRIPPGQSGACPPYLSRYPPDAMTRLDPRAAQAAWRRRRHLASSTSPPPVAMTPAPTMASVASAPGPVPPPVAGEPTGVLVDAGLGVLVPVGTEVAVLDGVAVAVLRAESVGEGVGVAVPPSVAVAVAVAVLEGVAVAVLVGVAVAVLVGVAVAVAVAAVVATVTAPDGVLSPRSTTEASTDNAPAPMPNSPARWTPSQLSFRDRGKVGSIQQCG